MVDITELMRPALEATGERFADMSIALSSQINENTFVAVMKQTAGVYTVDYSRMLVTTDREGNAHIDKVVWPTLPRVELLPSVLITTQQAVRAATEHITQNIDTIAPQVRDDKIIETVVENKVIDAEHKRFYVDVSFPLAVVEVAFVFETGGVVVYLDPRTGVPMGNQIPMP